MSSRSSSSVSKPASVGELVVELGQLLGLDLLDGDGELRLLAGQLGRPVVVGERDRDRALVAGRGALELLLEAGHEPAGAELDHLVAALAAGERLAVERAAKSMTTKSPRGRGAVDGLELGRSARAAARPRRRPARRGRRLRACRPRGPCSRRAWRSGARRSRSRTSAARPRRAARPGRAPGSPTGTIAAASIAAVYQPPIDSRTASSSTASRPTRLITTGGGALPARKPGTRMLRPSARAACATRFSTSPGHLGLHAHARLGQLGDGGGDGGGGHGAVNDTVAPCAPGSPPGSSPARSATSGGRRRLGRAAVAARRRR